VRNEIVSFDVLHVGQSTEGNAKLLVVCDKLSNYTQLYPIRSENALQVARALQTWFASFGMPRVLHSDQSPGFLNQLIGELVTAGAMEHHFVTAHSSWSNGKVERRMLDLGEAIRKWLSEFRMDLCDWESLVPWLQGLLNCSPTSANDGRSPLWAFTGLKEPRPLDYFLGSDQKWKHVNLSAERRTALCEEWSQAMSEREVFLHEYQEQLVHIRKTKHDKARGVRKADFALGDWVMAFDFNAKSKYASRFTGPAQVIAIKDEGNVFDIKMLSTKAVRTLHGRHLRFFDHSRMVVTPELVKQSEWFAKRKWSVEALLDIRLVVDQWQVLVRWEAGEDSWEIVDKLSEDIPDMLEDFLKDGYPAKATARRDAFLRHRNGRRGTVVAGGASRPTPRNRRPVKG
jgi:hypothetical protein